METYTLIDGAMRHAECPTFSIPEPSVRNGCEPGAVVKIGVEFTNPKGRRRIYPPCNGERFWVRVTAINPMGKRYRGEVDNDLLFTDAHGLRLGDLVTFGPEHVLEVWDWD